MTLLYRVYYYSVCLSVCCSVCQLSSVYGPVCLRQINWIGLDYDVSFCPSVGGLGRPVCEKLILQSIDVLPWRPGNLAFTVTIFAAAW